MARLTKAQVDERCGGCNAHSCRDTCDYKNGQACSMVTHCPLGRTITPDPPVEGAKVEAVERRTCDTCVDVHKSSGEWPCEPCGRLGNGAWNPIERNYLNWRPVKPIPPPEESAAPEPVERIDLEAQAGLAERVRACEERMDKVELWMKNLPGIHEDLHTLDALTLDPATDNAGETGGA